MLTRQRRLVPRLIRRQLLPRRMRPRLRRPLPLPRRIPPRKLPRMLRLLRPRLSLEPRPLKLNLPKPRRSSPRLSQVQRRRSSKLK